MRRFARGIMTGIRRRLFLSAIAAGLLGTAAGPAAAPTAAPEIPENGRIAFVIPVQGDISPSLTYVIRRGVRQAADNARVAAIVFDMDTNGGRLDVTERIVRLIQNLDAPTYTFVNASAFSAGAIIALATDRIYMAPNSRIGDAMPVMISPLGGAQEMPESVREKIVSAVAAMIRGAAQHKGHDPQLAEAMVRPEIEYVIDGEVISPAGELLTLTNVEAGRLVGEEARPLLSIGTVMDVETLLAAEGLEDTRIVTLTIMPAERFARLIESLSFLFLAGGLIGLYIEIRSPGFGFPGLAGLLLLGVWFWGHHVAGLSGALELFIFLAGFGLLLVEIFLLPGFGIAGGLGILAMLAAIFLSMVDLAPAGPILPRRIDFAYPLRMLAYTIVTAGAGIFLATIYLPKATAFRRLILAAATDRASGYQASDDNTGVLGQKGTAITALRPAGVGMFGERRLDIVSRGEFVEAGAPLEIVETHGNRIIVERRSAAV